MSDTSLTAALLDELRKVDTPTICNALEIVVPERRGMGFTTGSMVVARSELPPLRPHRDVPLGTAIGTPCR